MTKVNAKTIKKNESMIVITFISISAVILININLDKLNNSFAISFFQQ